MDKLAELLINPYIGIYVVLVAAIQIAALLLTRKRERQLATRRKLAGLGDKILVNQSQRLDELKTVARHRAL